MYQPELEAALEAAHLAGNALVDAYARFQAIPDAPASISTDADRQSQEIILQYLHARFPHDALCAEEQTATLAAARHSGERLWIVDPIDGTRGFARKNGEFSVMIAFAVGNQPVVGVVYEPARQCLTYAIQGGGCRRRDGDTKEMACRVSDVEELAKATLAQSHSQPGRPSRRAQALQPAKVIETYSAGIKLALVARAAAEVYLNTYEAFHDWDICAGHLLVTEAGGTVTDTAGNAIRYGSPGAWQRHGLLASNGRLHDAALARLRNSV
jgi:3'(2'), 5'-bisphosphate nucleotidase